MTDKQTNNSHINLKVQGQDGTVIHFKIRNNTPLRKLMNAYCERIGSKMLNLRFQFDGKRLNETDTPTSMEMEEGDVIEVFQTQTETFNNANSTNNDQVLSETEIFCKADDDDDDDVIIEMEVEGIKSRENLSENSFLKLLENIEPLSTSTSNIFNDSFHTPKSECQFVTTKNAPNESFNNKYETISNFMPSSVKRKSQTSQEIELPIIKKQRISESNDDCYKSKIPEITQNNDLQQKTIEILSQMLIMFKDFQHQLTSLANKIDSISSVDTQLSSDSLTYLPLVTIESLYEFDKKLISDKELQAKIIRLIKTSGGKSPKDYVANAMFRIITKEVAEKFNWEGGGIKKKESFKKLKLATMMNEALFETFETRTRANLTMDDVKVLISTQLKYAPAAVRKQTK